VIAKVNQWLAGLPAGAIGWVFLAGGILFLVGGAYQTVTGLAHDRGLEEKGRSVDGIVLEKTVSSTSQRTKWRIQQEGTRETYHSVSYRFSVLGEHITGIAEMDKDVWDRLHEQGPIRVTYLPDAPEIHRAEGEDPEFSPWKLLIFVAGGGVMLYVGRLLLADKLQLSSESESQD